METHPVYEELRLPDTPAGRVRELKQLQDEIFTGVPYPPGASGISLPPRPAVVHGGSPSLDNRLGEFGRKPMQALGYAGIGATSTQELKDVTG
jgi:hypothetical protein